MAAVEIRLVPIGSSCYSVYYGDVMLQQVIHLEDMGDLTEDIHRAMEHDQFRQYAAREGMI